VASYGLILSGIELAAQTIDKQSPDPLFDKYKVLAVLALLLTENSIKFVV
jgi:hypothetical protein